MRERAGIVRATAGRLVTALAAAALLATPASGVLAGESGPTEHEVKAAFLYNFAKFVTWPETAFTHSDDPLVITVVGEDPFGASWGVLSGKTVEGHPIVVSRASWSGILPPTHILFIPSSEQERLGAILDSVRGKPVLTVGDSPGYAEAGVMFNFFLSAGRVAFEVNSAAAAGTALKISSRLLSLGRPALKSN